jgi:hypothetical protein
MSDTVSWPTLIDTTLARRPREPDHGRTATAVALSARSARAPPRVRSTQATEATDLVELKGLKAVPFRQVGIDGCSPVPC